MGCPAWLRSTKRDSVISVARRAMENRLERQLGFTNKYTHQNQSASVCCTRKGNRSITLQLRRRSLRPSLCQSSIIVPHYPCLLHLPSTVTSPSFTPTPWTRNRRPSHPSPRQAPPRAWYSGASTAMFPEAAYALASAAPYASFPELSLSLPAQTPLW